MTSCPSCGRSNRDQSRFCNACGWRLDYIFRCPACDTVNVGDAAFCNECGERLAALEPPRAAPKPGARAPVVAPLPMPTAQLPVAAADTDLARGISMVDAPAASTATEPALSRPIASAATSPDDVPSEPEASTAEGTDEAEADEPDLGAGGAAISGEQSSEPIEVEATVARPAASDLPAAEIAVLEPVATELLSTEIPAVESAATELLSTETLAVESARADSLLVEPLVPEPATQPEPDADPTVAEPVASALEMAEPPASEVEAADRSGEHPVTEPEPIPSSAIEEKEEKEETDERPLTSTTPSEPSFEWPFPSAFDFGQEVAPPSEAESRQEPAARMDPSFVAREPSEATDLPLASSSSAATEPRAETAVAEPDLAPLPFNWSAVADLEMVASPATASNPSEPEASAAEPSIRMPVVAPPESTQTTPVVEPVPPSPWAFAEPVPNDELHAPARTSSLDGASAQPTSSFDIAAPVESHDESGYSWLDEAVQEEARLERPAQIELESEPEAAEEKGISLARSLATGRPVITTVRAPAPTDVGTSALLAAATIPALPREKGHRRLPVPEGAIITLLVVIIAIGVALALHFGVFDLAASEAPRLADSASRALAALAWTP